MVSFHNLAQKGFETGAVFQRLEQLGYSAESCWKIVISNKTSPANKQYMGTRFELGSIRQ